MYFPTIQGRSPEKRIISAFGGLNRSSECADNEFFDMENMTGEDFPCVATRPGREKMESFTEDGEGLDLMIADYARQDSYDKGTGIRVHDGTFDYYERGEKKEVLKGHNLCYELSGYRFFEMEYVEGKYVEKGEPVSYAQLWYPINAERFEGLVCFGNNIIAYPYPAVINRDANSINDSMEEKEVEEAFRSVNIDDVGCTYPCRRGNAQPSSFIAEPTKECCIFSIQKSTDSEEGVYTIFMNGGAYNPAIYTQYNFFVHEEIYKQIIIPGTRLRLEQYDYTDSDSFVRTGDFGTSFFVVTEGAVGKTIIEYGIGPDSKWGIIEQEAITFKVKAYDYNGQLKKDIEPYSHILRSNFDRSGVYMFKLKADINYLEVFQNRLWGTDTLGQSIYCSNATDFYDWEIDGTDAGAGYLDVPEHTAWTGIKVYNGYLYAFKAQKLYKILGSTALDYQIVCIADVGCTNHQAICVCDSVMYFLSRDGVYAFSGNVPVKVSEKLNETYRRGVLGERENKLYCSLETIDGKQEFLVYDTARRMWHKEDDFQVRSFVDYADGLYALGADRVCYKLDAGQPDEATSFSVTTKEYFYYFDQKAVSSVNLFLDMHEGSAVTVEIAYDGGEFESCGAFTSCRLKYIPVRLRKCDGFRFRISGKGFVRLKQLEFILHGGGRTNR